MQLHSQQLTTPISMKQCKPMNVSPLHALERYWDPQSNYVKQLKRAESKLYNAFREWSINAQVWAHGTSPVMRPGAAFDYIERLKEVMREVGMV